MWIRTQNRKILFKPTEISVCLDEKTGKYELIAEWCPLGAYSTEDQAMRVMDMLHRKIDTESGVFQMPEDETE